jgi:hypothetical protein
MIVTRSWGVASGRGRGKATPGWKPGADLRGRTADDPPGWDAPSGWKAICPPGALHLADKCRLIGSQGRIAGLPPVRAVVTGL